MAHDRSDVDCGRLAFTTALLVVVEATMIPMSLIVFLTFSKHQLLCRATESSKSSRENCFLLDVDELF